MSKAYEELKTRLAEVVDLAGAAAVLGWDHRTMMPRNGAVARSEQLGTLSKIVHTMFTAPEIGKLLDEAEPWAEEQGYDSLEAAFVRVVRRDYDKLVRVPPELSAELSRTAAIAVPVWEEAREESDWAMFQPYLEKVIELRRQYVECFPPADEDYDHPARRLRAGHEDGRGAGGVRRAEGGPRAAHRRDRRACRRRRRLVPIR